MKFVIRAYGFVLVLLFWQTLNHFIYFCCQICIEQLVGGIYR